MSSDSLKKLAAEAALQYIKEDSVVGVGTGSTVNFFISALATLKSKIEGAVSSSNSTTEKLKALGIRVLDLNSVGEVPIYIDGTDEVNKHLQLIKGAGGALTREKILASAAKKFICIADKNKFVNLLGNAAIPIEVIPMARSYVGRELVKMGGFPAYREGFTTDNGNIILDVFNLPLTDPLKLEQQLNNIAGVVCNGIFAQRCADLLLLGTPEGVQTVSL